MLYLTQFDATKKLILHFFNIRTAFIFSQQKSKKKVYFITEFLLLTWYTSTTYKQIYESIILSNYLLRNCKIFMTFCKLLKPIIDKVHLCSVWRHAGIAITVYRLPSPLQKNVLIAQGILFYMYMYPQSYWTKAVF